MEPVEGRRGVNSLRFLDGPFLILGEGHQNIPQTQILVDDPTLFMQKVQSAKNLTGYLPNRVRLQPPFRLSLEHFAQVPAIHLENEDKVLGVVTLELKTVQEPRAVEVVLSQLLQGKAGLLGEEGEVLCPCVYLLQELNLVEGVLLKI